MSLIIIIRRNVTGLAGLEGAETTVDIEPWTGLAFRSHLRFQVCQMLNPYSLSQVNAHVTSNLHIEAVRRVHRGGFYLPVVVSETRTAVSQKVIDLFDSEVFHTSLPSHSLQFGQPLRSAGTARLVGLIVGAFLLAISVSLIIVLVSRRYGSTAEKVPLLSNVQIAS